MSPNRLYSQFITTCLLALVLLNGSSCNHRDSADISMLISEQLTTPEIFLSIEDGASLEAVCYSLQKTIRHEFTVSTTNGAYEMLSCYVHAGEDRDYVQHLLFRNNRLVKFPVYIPAKVVSVPHNGTTAFKTTPWSITDLGRINKIIESPGITRQELRRKLAPREKTKYGQNPILSALVYGLNRATMKRMKQEYEINQRMRDQYDGCKIQLGMETRQVDAIYGDPIITGRQDGRTYRIYGTKRKLIYINSQYKYSFVAAVFDEQGVVIYVFSNSFYCDEWRNGGV